MPKISVIIPVYKVEQYLDRCVESVLAQTFTDFELILVDDGSPDNCSKMCDDWAKKDKRVMVIHQQNGGLSAARNAGIDWAFQNSDSQWITFIDSDDWVHLEYLQCLYDAVIHNNVLVSVCGFKRTSGESPNFNNDELMPVVWIPEDFYAEQNTNAVIACGKLISKSLLEDIRFPVGKIHEDEFTTHKFLFQCERIAVINAPLYAYYTNPNGIMCSKRSLNRTDPFDAIEQQIAYFEANGFLKARIAARRSYIQSVLYRINSLKSSPYAEKRMLREMYKRKRTIVKKHASHLNPNDPKDEFVLMKLYPVRTKFYIYFRAVLRKLRISK